MVFIKIKRGKTWIPFVTLMVFVATTLVRPSEGLSCYVCENCVRDKAAYYNCEEFVSIGKLEPNQSLVCAKSAAVGRITKFCAFETFGNGYDGGCFEPPDEGYETHYCTCTEDGCNGGMKTKLAQNVILGALGVSLIMSQGWIHND